MGGANTRATTTTWMLYGVRFAECQWTMARAVHQLLE